MKAFQSSRIQPIGSLIHNWDCHLDFGKWLVGRNQMLETRYWDASNDILVTVMSNAIGSMMPQAVARSDGYGRLIRPPLLHKYMRLGWEEQQSPWTTQSHYERRMLTQRRQQNAGRDVSSRWLLSPTRQQPADPMDILKLAGLKYACLGYESPGHAQSLQRDCRRQRWSGFSRAVCDGK